MEVGLGLRLGRTELSGKKNEHKSLEKMALYTLLTMGFRSNA